MPTVLYEIPETVESISRPVVYAVVDDLIKWLNFKDRPPIVYLGGANQPPTQGGFGEEGAKYNVFNAEARIILEVTEDYPEYMVGQQAQQRPENFVEFLDKDIGVYIKPLYQPIRVTLDFRIRTDDKTKAEQIRQSWKRLSSVAKEMYFHTVSYHYPIPLVQLAILKEIHTAREAVAGYGEDFGTWLKNCFSEKMTVITDQAGNNPLFAIRENQTGIQGWYDFAGSDAPKFEKDDEGGSWVASVSYQFQYDRVEGCVLHYPPMVHNQMLPTKVLNLEPIPQLNDIQNYSSLSVSLLRYFEAMGKPTAGTGEGGLSIPYFDEWIQECKYPHTQCLARMMLQVDPDNRNAVINLNELGDWAFDVHLLNYIQRRGNGIFWHGQSFIHVTLCEGQTIQDFDWMSIDKNLEISCSKDLQLRKSYHLNFAFNYNLPSLTEQAIADMAVDGALCHMVLLLVDPTMADRDTLPPILPDGSCSIMQLKEAMNDSYQHALLSVENDKGSRRFVGSFIINALRTDQESQ